MIYCYVVEKLKRKIFRVGKQKIALLQQSSIIAILPKHDTDENQVLFNQSRPQHYKYDAVYVALPVVKLAANNEHTFSCLTCFD